MKEKTFSTKTLKSQLFTAVAMLIVAAVALGTSTYAWFVNSQTANLEAMKFQASASSSLQIAVRNVTGAVATDYKSVIYNNDVSTTAGWENMFVTRVEPTSVVVPGRDVFFKSTGSQEINTSKLDKFEALTASADVGSTGAVKKIPLTFLSSSETGVYFGNQSIKTIANMIQDNNVKHALRMAIVPAGGTALVFQFSDENNNGGIAGATNNTYYPAGVTPAAVSDAAGTYNAIKTIVTTDGETKGQVATIGTQQCITTEGSAAYFAHVTSATEVTKGITALFTLTANTPKNVDVYFWLEGTDAGCVTNIADIEYTLTLAFASAK